METVVDPVTAVEGERLMLTSVPVRKSDAKLTLEEANRLAAGRSFELIDGRIIFKMPDSKHSDAHGLLCGELVITPEDQRWVKDVFTCP